MDGNEYCLILYNIVCYSLLICHQLIFVMFIKYHLENVIKDLVLSKKPPCSLLLLLYSKEDSLSFLDHILSHQETALSIWSKHTHTHTHTTTPREIYLDVTEISFLVQDKSVLYINRFKPGVTTKVQLAGVRLDPRLPGVNGAQLGQLAFSIRSPTSTKGLWNFCWNFPFSSFSRFNPGRVSTFHRPRTQRHPFCTTHLKNYLHSVKFGEYQTDV